MGLFQKCLLCVLIYRLQEKINNYEIKINRRPLKIYWNVPSFQCDPFKLNYSLMLDKYNVIQNEDARFRGETIDILYDPGNFPAILKKGNDIFLRNGGVPQEGNLTSHLDVFTEIVDQLIPDTNFSGLAIIDFESWRPVYRQNWGTLLPYKTLSEDLERQEHPLWPEAWVKKEAAKRFEESAGVFMQETLKLAKNLRPSAGWGYYHYPYCFNTGLQVHCPKQVVDENDKIKWLFDLSDNFYPSVYLQQSQSEDQRVSYIEGTLEEALRLKNAFKSNKKIYVYFWYKFQDTGNYLTKQDLFLPLTVLASFNIDGMILWGASADVNSKSNCIQLYEYMDKVFGPIAIHI